MTFTTNEPTTGWISYVAGTACPCTDAFSGGLGTSHTITLTGLAADTTYQVEAKAHDAANNAQTAAPISFQTLSASTDLEAPVVSIDSPTGGTVAGSVLLQATASDNVGGHDGHVQGGRRGARRGGHRRRPIRWCGTRRGWPTARTR